MYNVINLYGVAPTSMFTIVVIQMILKRRIMKGDNSSEESWSFVYSFVYTALCLNAVNCTKSLTRGALIVATIIIQNNVELKKNLYSFN